MSVHRQCERWRLVCLVDGWHPPRSHGEEVSEHADAARTTAAHSSGAECRTATLLSVSLLLTVTERPMRRLLFRKEKLQFPVPDEAPVVRQSQ